MIVSPEFFEQEPQQLAQALIGKVLRHRIVHPEYGKVWLSAKVIETEAYYLDEKGSHSSLGFTEARKAMFMSPGTIYMYYSRGGDSLNFSARGDGNGVLIKSGVTFTDRRSPKKTIKVMQAINPVNGRTRPVDKLCSGQTLLCRSLGLKVPEWNQQQLKKGRFILDNVGDKPGKIIQARRLGIPKGRDEHLPYRFVHFDHAHQATKNPLREEHSYILSL
ncbi:MAG: DNA-3-methyladenine glycosylase [Gammaproteobacteria bacterium]|jgi:DNA-3-methyladenine glycosylase|nr:DNA-3-methyladenine glycosylase [Gammaproteobacteria bacterium]MBT4494157.1 DNA-3-methyladenine glycosylase [Gammaproteobacteria bacterium]MBT7370437.1 DNA-3-methyladenine glycosylase [Gammaproteobacteria bacterium]